jgi:hypothetical protein
LETLHTNDQLQSVPEPKSLKKNDGSGLELEPLESAQINEAAGSNMVSSDGS